jgi:HEPN domain-containing protein
MTTDNYDVKEWIRFAQMDLDSSAALAERFRPPLEIVCYHCQQAVEKILKAYIIANTNAPPQKTHDLKTLLNVCVQYCAEYDKFRNICGNLTSYILLTRYPSGIDLTEHAMKQALKDAENVLVFTLSKLKEMGYE